MSNLEQMMLPIDHRQLEQFTADTSRPMFLVHSVMMSINAPGLATFVTQVGERLPDPEAQGEPSTTRLEFYEGAGAAHFVLDKACALYTPKPRLMKGVDITLRALIHEASPLRPHVRAATPFIDVLYSAFKSIFRAEKDVANVVEGYGLDAGYPESSWMAYIAGGGLVLAAVRDDLRRRERGW